jgi:hypothetical protein
MQSLTSIVAIGALLSAIPAWPAAPARVHVVELFTSQGCSSCPPADALLGELLGRSDVIALAFHVDYWDSFGWPDPFSMSDATRRQNNYAAALHLPSAFTPQIVIDGQASFVGSDRRRITAALAPLEANTDSVSIDLRSNKAELLIALPDAKHRGSAAIVLAAYLPKAVTAIGRGENSGRSLIEYNVVRQVRRLGDWSGSRSDYQIPLSSLPADATRVAILLQDNDQAILGAATLALP